MVKATTPHIIGLGVSAASRQALEEFLDNISYDSSAAFVIIQSPLSDCQPQLAEILLGRQTYPC